MKESGLSSQVEKKDNIQVYLPGLCVPRSYRLPMLDKIAIKIHCSQLKRIMNINAHDKFIVLCFDPDFYPFVEALNPTYTALHIYDVYHKIGKVSALFKSHLGKLLNKADLITASTQYLLDVVATGHDHKSTVIFNAADSEAIQSASATYSEPDLLQKIPHPRIGYLGAINRKIDFKSILQAIENKPDWQWVFMGPLNESEIKKDSHYAAFCNIQALPNVHFIGEITKSQIPNFLLSMDIHTLCLRTDEDSWATHSYPLKLNEYLATGAPVVSTLLPVIQKECSDLIYFADTPNSWEELLIIALNENNLGRTRARKEYAKRNGWDQRVSQYEKLLLHKISELSPL